MHCQQLGTDIAAPCPNGAIQHSNTQLQFAAVMRQGSDNSRKEEKNKRDGKGKWEKKDQRNCFLMNFKELLYW
jgi:hypothetical protein